MVSLKDTDNDQNGTTDTRFPLAGYGKVPDIPGAAPRKVELTSRTPKIAGSKTVKIRYGPYVLIIVITFLDH
jgi:hypothetical protein